MQAKLMGWHTLRMLVRQKPEKPSVMAIVILIALFCGAMYLLCRMVNGFTQMLSNAKKRRNE